MHRRAWGLTPIKRPGPSSFLVYLGSSMTLALTATGRSLVPKLAALAEQNDAEFFDHLGIKERSTIERMLRDIVKIRGLKSIPVE